MLGISTGCKYTPVADVYPIPATKVGVTSSSRKCTTMLDGSSIRQEWHERELHSSFDLGRSYTAGYLYPNLAESWVRA